MLHGLSSFSIGIIYSYNPSWFPGMSFVRTQEVLINDLPNFFIFCVELMICLTSSYYFV